LVDDAQCCRRAQAGLTLAPDVQRVGKYGDELIDSARAEPSEEEIGKAHRADRRHPQPQQRALRLEEGQFPRAATAMAANTIMNCA